MKCNIVDTTMRDGEQKSGLSFGEDEKIKLAKTIDSLGVYQIEAGIPAMGGEEKLSIEKIMDLNLKSKISAWNRLNIGDIKHSIDCRVHIIHIAVPVSELHIRKKLNKDYSWIIYNLTKCVYYTSSRGFEVSIGFEDASRAETKFLDHLCQLCTKEGVKRIRYADTVGILTPAKTYKAVKSIKEQFDLEVEIHAHNDFGLAVANSIAAVKAGAKYVDCTLGGIGERAGNCNYHKFYEANYALL